MDNITSKRIGLKIIPNGIPEKINNWEEIRTHNKVYKLWLGLCLLGKSCGFSNVSFYLERLVPTHATAYIQNRCAALQRLIFMVNFLTALLIFCFNTNVHIEDSLPVLEIQEVELTAALNHIIDSESRCNYYSPELIYSINLEYSDQSIGIGSLGFDIVKSDTQLGCFKFRGHLFIVTGRQLNSALFSETSNRLKIDYYRYKEKKFDLTTNDQYSIWIYKYDSNLILKDRYISGCSGSN